MIEAVYDDDEPITEAELVGLIVIVVTVCEDVSLVIIEDKVDIIVPVFSVELLMVSLVCECDDGDVPVISVVLPMVSLVCEYDDGDVPVISVGLLIV
jgi:hypothetical protein